MEEPLYSVAVSFYLSLVGAIAIAASDTIPMIGLNEDNQPIQYFIKSDKYQKEVAEMISSVQETTLPILYKRNPTQGWNVRTVIVGMGVDFEAGIPFVFKVGIIPYFSMAFSNAVDPILP